MKITTRLILSFLAVSILPLAAVSMVGLQAMNRASSLAIAESTDAMRQMGEEVIYQKARDVADQIALYLSAHPELQAASLQELEGDRTLISIAVQPVGESGYTAVYNSDGVTLFHANPDIVGMDLHQLSTTLPAFWTIMEASLDGSPSAGYYTWQDADGAVRDKYMHCLPVEGTDLRVAATTYIDEFYQPIHATEGRIVELTHTVQMEMLAVLLFVGFLAVWLGIGLARGISHPIAHLIQAAAALEQGVYRPGDLADVEGRRDDLGRLARVFDRMAREVQAREATLHRRIRELRIQIDETKRAQQVARITETEYFRELQEKARRMREGSQQEED